MSFPRKIRNPPPPLLKVSMKISKLFGILGGYVNIEEKKVDFQRRQCKKIKYNREIFSSKNPGVSTSKENSQHFFSGKPNALIQQ